MNVLVLVGPNGEVPDDQIKYAVGAISLGLGKATAKMSVRNGTGYGTEIETSATASYRRANAERTIEVLGTSSPIRVGNYDAVIILGEIDDIAKGFIKVFMTEQPKGKILHFMHPLYAGEDPQKISAPEGYAYKATQTRIVKEIIQEVQAFFSA